MNRPINPVERPRRNRARAWIRVRFPGQGERIETTVHNNMGSVSQLCVLEAEEFWTIVALAREKLKGAPLPPAAKPEPVVDADDAPAAEMAAKTPAAATETVEAAGAPRARSKPRARKTAVRKSRRSPTRGRSGEAPVGAPAVPSEKPARRKRTSRSAAREDDADNDDAPPPPVSGPE